MNPDSFSLPPTPALHRVAHVAMACDWELHLGTEDRHYAQDVAQALFAEVDRLEDELSRFVVHSDVSRLNSQEPGMPLNVGADAFDCLELSARLHRETGGAFDVTFDPSHRGRSSLEERTFRVELDRASHTATRLSANVRVDLGGIGKGYAVDRIVALLSDWGVERGLVHSGQSTLYARGRHSAAEPWRAFLRDPHDPARDLDPIALTDQALSGSGTAIHGAHIVDPRTGVAVNAPGAWCVASSAAVSDALSTAFMILEPGEIETVCRSLGVLGFRYPETDGARELLRFGSA